MRVLFDIGGTETKIATSFPHAPTDIQIHDRLQTSPSYDDFLRAATSVFHSLKATPSSVCISIGAKVNEGEILGCSKLPDYIGREIGSDVSKVFSCASYVAHDCVCAALFAYRHQGEAEALGYVTVSTGIGAAVVFEGQGQMVLERIRLAHHVVDPAGPKCACGRTGCLAVYLDSKQITSRFGKPLAQISDEKFWRAYSKSLAIGLVNLANLQDLDRIFLGGGVLNNQFLKYIVTQDFQEQTGKSVGYAVCELSILEQYETAPLKGASLLPDQPKVIIRG